MAKSTANAVENSNAKIVEEIMKKDLAKINCVIQYLKDQEMEKTFEVEVPDSREMGSLEQRLQQSEMIIEVGSHTIENSKNGTIRRDEKTGKILTSSKENAKSEDER